MRERQNERERERKKQIERERKKGRVNKKEKNKDVCVWFVREVIYKVLSLPPVEVES